MNEITMTEIKDSPHITRFCEAMELREKIASGKFTKDTLFKLTLDITYAEYMGTVGLVKLELCEYPPYYYDYTVGRWVLEGTPGNMGFAVVYNGTWSIESIFSIAADFINELAEQEEV